MRRAVMSGRNGRVSELYGLFRPIIRLFPVLLGVALFGASTSVAISASRDWRVWPFSRTSPWNMPVGSDARYAAVPGLDTIPAGLNHNGRWTSAVIVSTADDPTVPVRVNTSWENSNWRLLASGKPNCHNTAKDEQAIVDRLRTSRQVFPANPWSTLSPVKTDWQLPASYHSAAADFRARVHLRAGACPSPDTDGLMANFQPDGWVLDTYATIVLGNGEIISDGVASFVDAKADGTGWWNGRRASMLPSFAGLIRNGEIAAGRIPHALAMIMATRLLARQAAWPALAFDRDSASYAGPLPMGALLAIPPTVAIETLGLTKTGRILARAAQDYGVYIVDSTGDYGATLLAELGNPEIRWRGWQDDVAIVVHHLEQITNNSAATPGGGGRPRAALAPDFRD